MKHHFKVGDLVETDEPSVFYLMFSNGIKPPYTVSRIENRWVCIHPNKSSGFTWDERNFTPAGGPW